MPDFSDDPDVLIQRYVEGALSEAEAAKLLDLLQSQPALADRLLDHLSVDAMLTELKGGPSAAQLPRAVRRPQRFSVATLASVAALAACVTLALSWTLTTRSAPDEETTAAVAVLARGVNLQWEDVASAPGPGSPLSPGWLRLKSGVAQIEFYQGARVTLEGPAELELVSSSEAFCSTGRLSAHVPPQAKGFRLRTPQGTVVDLGTDFGLDLSTPSAPQVHVFKGEVEWHPQGAPMQSLTEGQAVTAGSSNTVVAADASAFASLANLEQRTADSERLAFEQWLLRSRRADADSALLLRFDFQDSVASRSLLNHATRSPQVPAGSIVGCDWTDGRWLGKRALEFRNISDRVRLSIPGEFRDLSFSAWVRVNGLDRAFNSLFMMEGYADGAVHWQITRQGSLRLGIAGRAGHASVDYDAPNLFTPERLGRWLHLATVYDSAANQVRHYLDGELVASLPVKHVFPLRLGLAELGNWNDGGRSDRVPVRHFSGAIQEFALFSRVLSTAEIAEFQ